MLKNNHYYEKLSIGENTPTIIYQIIHSLTALPREQNICRIRGAGKVGSLEYWGKEYSTKRQRRIVQYNSDGSRQNRVPSGENMTHSCNIFNDRKRNTGA